jgi:formylglycine-generating enzyme required for sulfatase activity
VERELTWWLEHRQSMDEVVILLTDGELVWDDHSNDYNWQRTTSMPPSMAGRFPAEALYVDLRWMLQVSERAKSDERSLLRLARNPYMLKMLAEVFLELGRQELPRNRALLFATFVDILLGREDRRHQKRDGVSHPGRDGAEEALGRFAWELQNRAGDGEKIQLAMAATEASGLMSTEQLNLARDASLLEVSDTVRFSHQLLQEYFVALGMRARIVEGKLPAERLWPSDHWWRRNGWEEAVVFLAGLAPDDPTLVIEWLRDAQPGLLRQCLEESGCAAPSDAQLADLQRRWLPRLDPAREAAPEARHPIALALGYLGLDRRPGIGLDEQGLPEINWVEISAGTFLYGEKPKQHDLPTLIHMARYPITNAQYQAFIDAGGYRDKRWWEGLAESFESPEEPRWTEPNRPRERVSWYEAMAFCRWLSGRLGYEIRLPTEWEWEKAARSTDGHEYPWGEGYRPGFANVNETATKAGPTYLKQTTAVGLYPQGASPYGVEDLAGNVWEWCLNEHHKPERIEPGGDEARVLRGGSWNYDPEYARAPNRVGIHPGFRNYDIGFRVVCSSPIPR